ncbi:related to cell wall integrity and stress response component 1 [Cephalotrichum gorgonifer]|uniref:Related to cell wall integrity and stress response component 1 n=1 Tax=Cephalotrichum gorgonifer TaxID=2041049 RepID=A0AAE8SW05_9PEZI|nr:related to cell wall integrity and stress response component 1 [Cephalotrichum gorgonifer]
MVILAAAIDPRATPEQKPITTPRTGAETSQGCFSDLGELKDTEEYKAEGVSSGFCKNLALKVKAKVFAMKGGHCYFGQTYPPKDTLVDDSKCDFPCPGYGLESCGGVNGGSYASVFNSGIEVDVPFYEPPAPTTQTSAAPQPTEDDSGRKDAGTINIAAVAAGTVVGVLSIAGAVGGVFFYMRRQRNKQIEEEHRRNAAVNSFIGHRPPGSAGSLSISDTRLDPIMAQRRMSDGSIADNEDYSRRILRVTNA